MPSENKITVVPEFTDDYWQKMQQLVDSAVQRQRVAEMNEKLISTAEACKMFSPPVSKVTFSKWAKDGLIQEHRIGGRIYFRQGDIIKSLQTLKKYKRTA